MSSSTNEKIVTKKGGTSQFQKAVSGYQQRTLNWLTEAFTSLRHHPGAPSHPSGISEAHVPNTGIQFHFGHQALKKLSPTLDLIQLLS